jgi:adenine-specific DNA methylase
MLAGSSAPAKQREDLCRRIENVTRWGKIDEIELDRFRKLIRKAHGGETPKVLDVFSGGGAIPFEAMRLGAHAFALEYNPVAWFILKCTLEFPSRLATKMWPLPEKQDSKSGAQMVAASLRRTEGDLEAQVRHWGAVLRERVMGDLAPYFPARSGESLVAYLWARTAPCHDPQCGVMVPLLKTLWLDTRKNKLRALRLRVDKAKRVRFDVIAPKDSEEVGAGTMSGAKARCPACGTILRPEYLKECGLAGRIEATITAVVYETASGVGKEFRASDAADESAVEAAKERLKDVAARLPHGALYEPLEHNPRTLVVGLYGFNTWDKLFAPRQQLALATVARRIREIRAEAARVARDEVLGEAVAAYLACMLGRLADRNSTVCSWQIDSEKVRNTFGRYVLQMTWDYCEVPPLSEASGGFLQTIDWVADVVAHASRAAHAPATVLRHDAAAALPEANIDAVITDPPYYSAIPYGDLSDFFYVWLRRTVAEMAPEVFETPTVPKDNELALRLPHAELADGRTVEGYERGISQAFANAVRSLRPDGRMVIVFAHKDPDAWERLVTALIASGSVTTASWPIASERTGRVRSLGSAALSTSVWLVCRPRTSDAVIGRYKEVRQRMEARIAERLRFFWDMGISGPDFVWAAVGPALEAYSEFREVRRIDGSPFTVKEFLREVRRLVTDFALGQILHGASTEGLDEWTRYYLMHRSSFGLELAPAGECILLSQGYNLDLNELRGARAVLAKGKRARGEDEDTENGDDESAGGGSDLRLLGWDERKRDDLGLPHPSGGLPLIDALHRMIHLWSVGDTTKLRDYADEQGLRQNELLWTVAQAVLEMSDPKSRERTLLEALVAWGRGTVARVVAPAQRTMLTGESTT